MLLLVFGLSAQQRTGNIYGKVVDTESNPLPGVTVTLTGSSISPLTTVTNERGDYRFSSLSPATDYSVSAELKGFEKTTQTNIIVDIGKDVLIDLTMELGALEREVTFTATTLIFDAKKTATASNFNREELQSLPTARDPWAVMQMAPSIMLDRENIAGNESGQQAGFLSRGDSGNNFDHGANNIWALDGIDISDPAALGESPLHYDFDMFEELNITTGGADVSIQTGGIAINMVTRRGQNKTNLAGRFFLTDSSVQAHIRNEELLAAGRDVNKIQAIKDYGFNAGGPIIKDRVWWWAGYGVQDILTSTVFKTKDQSLLNDYTFKLNAQLFSGNRFEALVTAGAKEKFGRNASLAKPEGDHQKGKHHFGSPIFKFQDEQAFGSNFYMALKYSFNDIGFGWVPMVDEDLQYPVVYDETSRTYVAYETGYGRSWDWYSASRQRNNIQANAAYYSNRLLGLSQEIKLGAEFTLKHAEEHWNFKQNYVLRSNFHTPMLDTDGNGTKDIPTGWQRFDYGREAMDNSGVLQYAGYISDTITAGRFTFILGVRFDFQRPFSREYQVLGVKPDEKAWDIVSSDAQAAMDRLLPAITVNEIRPDYNWRTWSPRLGITWDITGDGKTIAKLALAQYGDIMGTGTGLTPPLGLGGWANFWWRDLNSDRVVDLDELYWVYSPGHDQRYQLYNVFDSSGHVAPGVDINPGGEAYAGGNYGGVDLTNPTALDYESSTTVYGDESKASSRTRELLVTLEREILPDFGASINFTFRRYDRYDWRQPYYPQTGERIDGPSWYRQAGTVPDMAGIIDTGDAAGRLWYTLKEDVSPTDYTYVTKGDNYRDWWGIDLVLTKRLSDKWYLNASFTWQDGKDHWGTAWADATNQWAFDGRSYSMPQGAASGKAVNAYMYSRWLAKLSWLFKLPFDFHISGIMNAREGWRIPHFFWLEDSNLPGLYTGNWIYTQEIVRDALPTFYSITLRIEKMVKIGDFGRLTFMVDMFNVLNKGIENRRYEAYLGDYYLATGTNWINPTNRVLFEVLNPRITRFGARFTF